MRASRLEAWMNRLPITLRAVGNGCDRADDELLTPLTIELKSEALGSPRA
jgi:hypothetical protein